MSRTVVVRRIAATPVRSATEAWSRIADLISPGTSLGREELDAIAGIGISLIGSESPRNSPIVVWGVGPRLRIYAVYDEDAIVGDGLSEDPLAWSPTSGEWAMSLPCLTEDLSWVQAALARSSTRVTARDISDAVPADNVVDQPSAMSANMDSVNIDAFLRP